MLQRFCIFQLYFVITGFAPLAAQLWEFGEADGTSLGSLSGSSGDAWNSDIPGVRTDGQSRLVFLPTLPDPARSFVQIPPVSTGTYEVKVVVSGWNFEGSPAVGPLLEVGLATSPIGLPTRTVAHFSLDTDTTSVALFGSAGGQAASETSEATDRYFPLVRDTPLTIKLVVNFDAGTYSVSTSDDNFLQQASGLLASPRREATHLFFRTATDYTLGGHGFLKLDRLSYGQTRFPSGFVVWQTQSFTESELQNQAISGILSDANGDGVPNLVRFATGELPRPVRAIQPLEIEPDGTTLRFRRPQDPVAAGVSQEVEISPDLVQWRPANFPVISVESHGDGYETVRLGPLPWSVGTGNTFLRLRVVSF